MVKKEKCSECRSAKVKCFPEDRIWDLDLGITQKCNHCLKGGRACGPNETPPDPSPHRRDSRAQKSSSPSSVTLLASPEMTNEDIEGSLGSFSVTGGHILDNSKELRERLKELDVDAELVKKVQVTIETMENQEFHRYKSFICSPEYYNLHELQLATTKNLLTRLSLVEALADRVQIDNIDLAEKAYTRMLDIYERQPLHFAFLIRSLLMKMALFYSETDQHLRAQKCWENVFTLRDSIGNRFYIERDVWEKLALSSSKTSEIIANAFRAYRPDFFPPLNLSTPFPPVHAMIRSQYYSELRHQKSGRRSSSDNGGSPHIHLASVAGTGSLWEIIQRMPDTEVGRRDIVSLTPLFLAAFLKQEDAGHALMARIAALSGPLQKLRMNDRGPIGQSILGIAILSGCSEEFVKALINSGARIDPEVLLQEPLTPLQAACLTQRVDIVRLLLKYGAKVDHVHKNNRLPKKIALELGNHEITQLIADHDSPQRDDRIRSNVFEEDGHESSVRDISDFHPDFVRKSNENLGGRDENHTMEG